MEDFEFGPWIATSAVVVLAILVNLIASRAGSRWVRRAQEGDPEKGARVTTLWRMIKRVIQVAVIFTAVLFIFSIFDISLAPFIAVGTVFAAALGFGAQDVVKDLLAGFFILAEDQFHVGDVVGIADTSGTVEDIQFRVTVLRDYEGRLHFVPNGQIKVTTNYTNIFAKPIIDVGIAYKEDADHAMAIMLEELESMADDPEWQHKLRGPAEIFGVQDLGDSAVLIRGQMTTEADDRWSVRREALRRIKKRFDSEGIEIPFPHITVYYGEI
jgi:small conductance mechanosensitive channel